MPNTILLLMVLLISSISTGFCDDHRDRLTNYTEEQVREIVKPGMTRESILAVFGKPLREKDEPSAGYYEMIYVMQLPLRERDFQFTGFEVFLVNGRVVKWEPVHETIRMH
jgi:hypothetical protein